MDSAFGVWQASAPPAPDLPILDGDADIEVVIIGAGYTGLSTALHLAEQGIQSVVLEAKEPGWGGSGRNAGWLEPCWWLKKLSDINALFGSERGEQLSRWVASGPALLDKWIEQYALGIEINRTALLYGTDQPEKARALEAEAREWQALDVTHEYIEGREMLQYIFAPRYCGGLVMHSGVTLNPLALSRELSRACEDKDVYVFGQSPVTSIEREDGQWRVTTPGGSIRARRLILATDAYTRDLWPELQHAYATWHMAVIASEAYAGVDEILPCGTPFADLSPSNIFTLRGTTGRRLVTSTFAPLNHNVKPAKVAEPFMRKFEKVFPHRLVPRWQYAHFGEIGITKDRMPRLASIGPQAWTAFGYSGSGINLALLLGGELAKLAVTDDAQSTLFPVTQLEPLKMRRTISWALRYIHGPVSRGLISRIA